MPLQDLPLQTDLEDRRSTSYRQFEGLKPRLIDILTQKKVQWSSIHLTRRYPRNHVPPERCTILIDASRDDDDAVSWTTAFYDCVGVLMTSEVDFAIEMEDPRAQRSFFVPTCSPEFRFTWENQIRKKVLDILKMEGWRAMTLLKYGREEEHGRMAIVITKIEESRRDWSEVRKQIKQMTDECHFDVDVVFIRE